MDTNGHTAKTEGPRKRFWTDYDAITKFNFIIALFAVVSALAGIGLYFVSRDTLTTSQKAFIYSSEALIVGDGGKPGFVQQGKPAWLYVTLKNSGQTPARKVLTHLNYCATVGELPQDFSYPPPPGPERPRMLIGPQSQAQIGGLLPDSVLVDIETSKRNLFVYGDVVYEDVFDKWHKTEFCHKYGGWVMKPDGSEIERHYFQTCQEHNCYDDDCPKKWGDAPCPMIGAKLIPAP